MNKRNDYDKWILSVTIKGFLSVLCWLALFVGVISAGFTIGLLVMWIIKGGAMPIKTLDFFMQVLSKYTLDDITVLVSKVGVHKVALAGVGYGFAYSFTYIMLYMIITKFKTLFDTIIDGKMFTIDNSVLIEDTIPITILYALTQPVLVFIISSTTGVFDIADVRIRGLALVFAIFILKFIFDKGLEINKNNASLMRKEKDLKATAEEADVELIKKDAKIKSLEEKAKELKLEIEELKKAKEVKETQKKVEKPKKETKKAAPKKVEKKAPKKPAKKQPVKKETKKTTKK